MGATPVTKKISIILCVSFILWNGVNTSYAQTQKVECHEIPALTSEDEFEWLKALAEALKERGFGFYIHKDNIAASNMGLDLANLVASILQSRGDN